MVVTSRNAPCPCGSGKKFKNCCLAKDVNEKKAGRRKRLVILIVLAAVIISGIALSVARSAFAPGPHDALAKCLTGKGYVVYGAYWCDNCDRQKELFGKSFKYINYVECGAGAGLTEKCKRKGIKKIPAWITPDGDRLTGVHTPEELAEESACGIND